MYLKKIEISGFKSFADRTTITFDQGLTAVVGPNGSGKSNITEAIRWVLGEQSAKNLRGGKMPDVIFAGTAIRKPLNIAEVTVVLDNEERFLPLDFSEVSVTRRLNRSGDSDFFINKQNCRLKDIIDLFMDSGLGKESFSIISQGKVEAIFNSKPEDRRGIFEEAAGVLKYKQRKKKAEQKLFETEDNLNRVQDIIYELESQLAPLKEQSETAQEYLLVRERLVEVDVGVTVQEIEKLREQWETKHYETQTAETQIKELQAEIQLLGHTLETVRGERAQLDGQLDGEQQQLLAITEAYEQAEGQKNVLEERSKNTEKTSLEYQTNLTSIQTKLAKSQQEFSLLEQQLADKKQEKKSLEKQIRLHEESVIRYSKSAKERLEELRAEYVEIMQAQANTGNDLKHLEREYQQESNRNQHAVAQYEELLQNQAKLQKNSEATAAQLTVKMQELTEYREKYKKEKEQALRLKQQLTLKEKQMYDAMGILQQAKARQKSLKELQENYAGFYQGVKSILKAKGQLPGIVGAVAELTHVPKELSLAIETALGGAAQHVIVQDEQAGRTAITYLKNQRLGRATFLPLTTIKPRSISETVRKKLGAVSGFMGVACEKVTYPEEIRNVLENILGATLLAKNLTAANEIAKQVHYQYRVVSLDGDIMNPGGSMTGGANKKGNQGNLFTQANELAELTNSVSEMQTELQKREKQVQDLKVKAETSEQLVDSLRQKGENARIEEQELKNNQDILQSESRQLTRELQSFEHESQELNLFLKEYETKKTLFEATLLELQANRIRLDEAMNQTDEEENKNSEKRAQAQDRLNASQAQRAVIDEQVLHIEQLTEEQQKQLIELTYQVERVNQQIQLLSDDHSSHTETQESIAAKMNELQKKKIAVQNSLTEKKAQREKLHEKIAQADNQLTAKNQQQQELLKVKAQLEVLKDRAERGLDQALEHLREEYNLTYEAGKEQYTLDLEMAEAKQQTKQLKQQIEQLGSVNVAAIEQYQEVEERYQFLTAQRDDLVEAKESLFDTMNEMDAIVKEKFGEVFDAISLKFQKVFPNMFGGGHAELKLTDPYDLLNTGIEIVAQPPGKKLQSLSLLSGGERALTAIALLFAIIQVRPVPFCILDEVEAALDEANVNRFGQYLSKFEDQIQFIVITHRKGTMEAADVLYGITMQESGVSKVVSVRLEEINEQGNIATSLT